MLEATAGVEDTAGVVRAVHLAGATHAAPADYWFMQWRAARFFRDRSALRRIWGVLDTMSAGQWTGALYGIARVSRLDGRGLGDAEHAVSRLRTLGEPVAAVGHEAAWTALAGGHYTDWLTQLHEWLGTLPPPEAAEYRILSALFFGAPADSGTIRAARTLEALPGPRQHQPATAAHWPDAKCWLAQWRLAEGNDTGGQAALRPRDDECTALLKLRQAEHDRGDVRAAALRLDSISLSLPAGTGGGFYEVSNLVLARTFLRLGDPARAFAAARRRCYGLFCDGMVFPSQRLAEARAAAAAGDTLAAVRAYDEYLFLRGHADGGWRAEADSARAERARLHKS